MRKGSFTELNTYLHLSADRPQPITHREMDVIQMSESFQWHVLPEPRVSVLIKCISQADWIKPELKTTKTKSKNLLKCAGVPLYTAW